MTEAEPLAKPEDLEGIWRPLSATETTVAENLLRYASLMVRNRVPRLQEWIDDGAVHPDLVKLAVVLVVKRVMMNPEAARQRSLTAGPFTENITIDSALSSGALYVSDADLAVFLPASPTGTKIGTARVQPGFTRWMR